MGDRQQTNKKSNINSSPSEHRMLQSRPFTTQRAIQTNGALTQQEIENQQYQQDRFEATKLEIQAKYGTITPEGQERLSVLQAQKADFWQRYLAPTKRFSQDFANIPVTRPRTSPQQPIQAQLTIGAVGDKYELEADRVASLVVNQINAPVSQPTNQNLQREEMSEEDKLQMKSETDTIHREDMPEEELQMKPMLQLQTGEGGVAATSDLETSIQQARGSGQSLAENIRKPMERSFGADFSRVKVHTDRQSDQLNRSIQARAFTTGQDVFFRSGEYNPGSRGGQELIAHELTHVVQQNGGAVQRSPQQLEQVATARIASGSHVIQRVTETEVPSIISQLPKEYQMHFQKETAQFDENEKLKNVRDDSNTYTWKVLKNEARKEAKKQGQTGKFEEVLERWDVRTAAEKLRQNADEHVKRSRDNREVQRGEENVSPFMKGGEIIKFEAPPFGNGTLEMLKNGNEVLLFAAHGFTHKKEDENQHSDIEKAYGFMSGKYESVARNNPTEKMYEKMANKLKTDEEKYKIKGFPDLVVFPHYASDALSKEGEFLGNLVSNMDIAILRDWEWKDTPEGKGSEKSFINTVPLRFILGSSTLNHYSKYLMQVCRADWSRDAGVSGGSKRVSPDLTTW